MKWTVLGLMMLACKGEEATEKGDDGWLLAEEDLGADLATGTGFAPANGADLYSALEQTLPGLLYGTPMTEVPLSLWELAQNDNIADMGSCPYSQADGDTIIWKTGDCRSRGGYNWSGQLAEITHARDPDTGYQAYGWDLSLSVEGDVDNPSFDALTLQGGLRFTLGDEETLARAAQVNAIAGVQGYWERISVADPRAIYWDSWAFSGRMQTMANGETRVAGKVDLGAAGGFSLSAEALNLDADCPAEPDGRVTIETGSSTIVVEFDGATACDRCANYSVDGEFAGRACGS